MRASTPQEWEACEGAYRVVKDLAPREQRVVAVWLVVTVLSDVWQTSRDTSEGRTAFDRTCDEILAYLPQQIEALTFPGRDEPTDCA